MAAGGRFQFAFGAKGRGALQFFGPSGVALADDENVMIVVDQANQRIQVLKMVVSMLPDINLTLPRESVCFTCRLLISCIPLTINFCRRSMPRVATAFGSTAS